MELGHWFKNVTMIGCMNTILLTRVVVNMFSYLLMGLIKSILISAFFLCYIKSKSEQIL